MEGLDGTPSGVRVGGVHEPGYSPGSGGATGVGPGVGATSLLGGQGPLAGQRGGVQWGQMASVLAGKQDV